MSCTQTKKRPYRFLPMSPARLFARYKIQIAFVFATLVLLAVGLSSFRAIDATKSSTDLVRHTYQVIGAIDDLTESLALVHSTARSFALTGDAQYLQLNRTFNDEAAAAHARLQRLTRDNVEQQQRLPEIEGLSTRITERADTVIAARRDQSAEQAINRLRTGEGSRNLEQFRQLAAEFKNRELGLLAARERQSDRDFTRTQYALAVATLIALILTASAGVGTIRDIRRRKKVEAELFIEKEQAQVTLASIGDGVLRADATGNVTFLNRAGTELTGWPETEAVGKPLWDVFTLIDATTRSPIVHRMQDALAQDELIPLPETALLVRRDGKEVPVEDTITPIRDEQGNFSGAVNVFRDVSEAREAAQQLRHVAQHDPLTGLPNRMLLDDRISRAISMGERHGKKVALLYLDLDGFKLINDTRGHAIGDMLLQEVTARLRACVRDCDTVCRLGGDEFVILLPEIAHSKDAAATARRILKSISAPHPVDGVHLTVTASIGISLYPDDAASAGELLANADAAMYEAKSSGRAAYFFYPAAAAGTGAQRRA